MDNSSISNIDYNNIKNRDKRLMEKMRIEHTYPSPTDPKFQSKIYQKREFYYHKYPERKEMKNYDDLKKYRDRICAGPRGLLSHQSLLSNFMNPDTPYKGLLIFHGTGTGKSCAAISIAEKFKPMVQRYGTKIFVLVPGPLVKDNWKDELLTCTGETYLKYQDKSVVLDEQEEKKLRKNAINNALQYYRFMSNASFYKKVLGEKIKERRVVTGDKKTRVTYRKTAEGEFERDISIDKIENLDNSVIIIDEAHNLTGNTRGEALTKIIRKSKNLRVILLSATPMKNLADDIIELLNFIRPQDSPILRDKVFTSEKNHNMEFKKGGIEYLKNMSKGYVSYLRGGDPLTFAKKVEKGIRPKELLFTKITPCTMEPFQKELYITVSQDEDDTLDRRSEAVASFVFPGLSDDKKGIKGYFGINGITKIIEQLKNDGDLVNKLIAKDIIKDKNVDENSLLYIADNNRTLTGKIMHMKYLKTFSTKFHEALTNLNKLVWGDKGARTAFVYSNLVRVGIEIFREILIQNGYLEYQEIASDYVINEDTICYFCGRTHASHDKKDKSKNGKKDMPKHDFHPATFIMVTGIGAEETEVIPEDKQRILRNVFSNKYNKDGRYIKFVLGSKVMNEGISLKNVAETHILDVYYNFGKVEQVIGRAVRHCSHHQISTESNQYPSVNIYKYAVITKGVVSSEIELYRKAELKHILVKKVERALKQVAIDCPLNMAGNIFPEDLEKYKKCGEPSKTNKKEPCPSKCDYTDCNFNCEGKVLNSKYYDPKRIIYKKIPRDKLDYSTFTHSLAKEEIEFSKSVIKNMFKSKFAYTLRTIIKEVKDSYNDEKRELFDEFFVYKALDELIPVTENDFNNFKDTILDKFNRPGYLIYIHKYYIYQPFEENENVPMYYRTTFNKDIKTELPIGNYMKHNEKYQDLDKISGTEEVKDDKKKTGLYDFESVRDYYDNRDEYKYVGIVDKETSRKKSKLQKDLLDVFKLREKRAKILEKKRGTGIPSLKGAVCATAKDRKYLENVAKKIGADISKSTTRIDICNNIKNRLLHFEKYGTKKKGTKITYIMIPKNHKKYKFPYNLEDRINYIKETLGEKLKKPIKAEVKQHKHKKGELKGLPYYEMTIKHTKDMENIVNDIKGFGGDRVNNKWIINIG